MNSYFNTDIHSGNITDRLKNRITIFQKKKKKPNECI